MRCEEIRETLPAFADGYDESLAVRRHLSGCPDCRAELDRYESLATGMRSLAHETIAASPALVSALYEIPSHQDRLEAVRSHLTEHRKAYVGGAAALAAAGVSALVWRSRRGRLVTA
jgi:predicted anti-sigma-YlaC factor YlaD